jgi:hypothetical protein
LSEPKSLCTPRSSASIAQSSSPNGALRSSLSRAALSAGLATATGLRPASSLATRFAWFIPSRNAPHLPQRRSPPLLGEPSPGTSCWQVEHHMRKAPQKCAEDPNASMAAPGPCLNSRNRPHARETIPILPVIALLRVAPARYPRSPTCCISRSVAW